LAVPIILSNTACAQTRIPILFQREKITISIAENRIAVHGEYVLSNMLPASRSVGLFYPFPVDSLHPFPLNVSVVSGDTTVPFRKAEDGIYFRVKLLPKSSAIVSISYDQQCLVPKACYILKSTAAWHAPLEEADFEIHVPKGIELKSMSYAADEILKNREAVVYSFTRKKFMPSIDLCFEWDNKKRDTK
jgi:hypothetical protein